MVVLGHSLEIFGWTHWFYSTSWSETTTKNYVFWEKIKIAKSGQWKNWDASPWRVKLFWSLCQDSLLLKVTDTWWIQVQEKRNPNENFYTGPKGVRVSNYHPTTQSVGKRLISTFLSCCIPLLEKENNRVNQIAFCPLNPKAKGLIL